VQRECRKIQTHFINIFTAFGTFTHKLPCIANALLSGDKLLAKIESEANKANYYLSCIVACYNDLTSVLESSCPPNINANANINSLISQKSAEPVTIKVTIKTIPGKKKVRKLFTLWLGNKYKYKSTKITPINEENKYGIRFNGTNSIFE